MKRDSFFKKLFFQLLAVNILIGLIQPFNQFVDSVLTGRGLGVEALKAYALFLPLGALSLALSCVFSIGTQISCSHRIGKGRIKEGKDLFATSLLAVLAFSTIFSSGVFFFSKEIAIILGHSSEEVVNALGTAEYIRGYSIGIVPMFLLNIMLVFMQVEGKKILVTIASIGIFAINLTADLLNLYVFKGGLFGMAFATSVSYIAVFVFVLCYFIYKSNMFRLSSCRINTEGLKDVFKNGIPSLAYYGSLVIRAYVYNWLIITYLDVDTLSVMLVINSYLTLVDAFIGGTGDVTLLLGCITYGEKDKSAAKRLLRTAVIAGTAILTVVTIITMIFAEPIAMFFSEKGGGPFVAYAARALRITALCFVPDEIACVLKKYIQSVGRAMYTSVTNVLCNVIYVCSFAFLFVGIMGSDGLFLSYFACYTLILLTHIVYAFVIAKKEGAGRQDVFLYLPRDYAPENDHVFEMSINSIDEALDVSVAVGEFCTGFKLNRKICNYMSLFIEEIAGNIIRYGFKDEYKNVVFVRVVIGKGHIALFIKDNCMYFDPTHYYKSLTEKTDVTKNIGIRLVMSLADKVQYTNRFNMNHLMIEIPF